MNYALAMHSVLRLDETIYSAIMQSSRTARYCMLNVLIFGFLHALFSLVFSPALLTQGQPAAPLPLISKIIFILIGVAVAFFMHAGAALFLWVFSRGIGGNPAFFPIYFNLGISFVGLWPLAPLLAALQAGYSGAGLQILLGIASIYGLAVILLGSKSASGLSMKKMLVAMGVTIVFVACFLYLWL